jgi:hypothetical protein
VEKKNHFFLLFNSFRLRLQAVARRTGHSSVHDLKRRVIRPPEPRPLPDPRPSLPPPLRSALAGPLQAILIGLLFAVGLSYWVAGTAPDFEDLALGDATKSVYGSYDGDKIFCGSIDEAPQCLGPVRRRALPQQVLWLGNSQLHAINQPKSDDVTAPVVLARRLRPRRIEVQAMSFPNASLTEFHLAWLFQRQDRHIDVLVVPLFLDDAREGSVRDILVPVARRPDIAATLRSTGAAAHSPSLQDRSEAAITRALEACCGFQIYFDFAGYSAIAIGVALLMGIRFPENFAFSYLSYSPRTFWRRRHISLSSWIGDYYLRPISQFIYFQF